VAEVGTGAADNGDGIGQRGVHKHPVQGRDHLSGRQVAGCPENDDGAGLKFVSAQTVTDVVGGAGFPLDDGWFHGCHVFPKKPGLFVRPVGAESVTVSVVGRLFAGSPLTASAA